MDELSRQMGKKNAIPNSYNDSDWLSIKFGQDF